MADTPAVSGPDSGNAGDVTDGLDAAFDAAFESIDLGDDKFVPAAKPADKTAKPTDTIVTEDAAKEAEPGDGGEPKAEGEEGQPKPVAPEPSAAAPAHWDAAKREAFGKLTDPAAQKIVLDLARDLEAGFTKKSQELSEDRKFAQGVRSLITDGHRQQLRSAGMDEVGGIRHLLKLQDFAAQDFDGYIRWAVQQAGRDPRQIFQQLAGGEPDDFGQMAQPQPDPQSQQLNEALQNVNARLEAFERSQAEQQDRAATRAINDFRSAVDESGQVKHPHFAKVERDMTWILQNDPEIRAIDDLGQRLQRAYETAVYRDPEIKTQLIDSEVQRRLAASAAQAEVEKAKRAKAPIRAPAPAAPAAKPKTLDEAARQAMSQMGVS